MSCTSGYVCTHALEASIDDSTSSELNELFAQLSKKSLQKNAQNIHFKDSLSLSLSWYKFGWRLSFYIFSAMNLKKEIF